MNTCPACGCEVKVRSRPAWLVRLIGDRPRAPYCQESDGGDNDSGWPAPCGCAHPCHAR